MTDVTQSLPHQLLLLEMDDFRGKSKISDSILRGFGLAGAVVAELVWQQRLIPAKANRFVLNPDRPPTDGVLAMAETRLSESKPRTLFQCINRMKPNPMRKFLLNEMVEMGMLREENERLMIIIPRRRWYPGDNCPEESIVEHMRHYLEQAAHNTPPSREDLLLSLLRVTKLMGVIWEKEELADLQETIEQCTKRTPIGKDIHKAVQHAYAAMAAAAAS